MRRGNGYEQTFQRIAMGAGSLAQTSKTIGQMGSIKNTNSRSRRANSNNADRLNANSRQNVDSSEPDGGEDGRGSSTPTGERGPSNPTSTSERQLYWNRIAQKHKNTGEPGQ